jgi:hypothetical protein
VSRLLDILREIVGLFIDDGSLAIGILIWIAIVALVFPALGVPDVWRAIFLFGGCAAILIENVARSARRSRS